MYALHVRLWLLRMHDEAAHKAGSGWQAAEPLSELLQPSKYCSAVIDAYSRGKVPAQNRTHGLQRQVSQYTESDSVQPQLH